MFRKVYEDLLAMSKLAFKQLQLIKEKLDGIELLDREEEFDQNELMLDGLEVKIRKNVINSIVLYGPRASDLRKIMSCYDIAMHLERVGDLVLNIRNQLRDVDFDSPVYDHLHEQLSKLLASAELMVRNAISSFTHEDISLTQETIHMDDYVDSLFHDIRRELVTFAADKTTSAPQLAEVISLNSLSYHIERIADEATNIAEAAVYLIEGRTIQHAGELPL